MNLIRSLAILLTVAAVSCNSKPSFEIKGTVTGIKSGKIYFQKFHNKYFTTIDSALIEDGKFHLSGSPELPELYGLTIDTTRYPLFVFLNAHDKLTVDLDTSDYLKSKIGGSAENEFFLQYKLADKDINIDSFIHEHPKSLVALYILYRDYSYRLTYDQIEKNVAQLDSSFANTQYVKTLTDLIEKLKNVQVGKKAPDFSLPDTSGKEVTLSSKLGKYLLLDFWASWCGPCRHENPSIVKAYLKYHSLGFDIVGVSLDKHKENWLKAIENDHLTWTHLSDLAYWNSKAANLYGIRAIPSNLLLDPNGVIIARNVFDEQLDHALDSVLVKK